MRQALRGCSVAVLLIAAAAQAQEQALDPIQDQAQEQVQDQAQAQEQVQDQVPEQNQSPADARPLTPRMVDAPAVKPAASDDASAGEPPESAPARAPRTMAGPITGLDLKQAVELALERHPSISGARAMVVQTEAQVSVAKSARWPVISYGVAPGYDPNQGRNSNLQGSLGVSQTLYDFGVTPGTISGAEARRDRQTHVAANASETVAQQAAETTVEMVAAQETMAAADRQATALEDIRVKIVRRVKAGLADVSDLKRTDVSRERALADRLQAETRYNVAADTLAQIIGARVSSVVDMAATLDTVQAMGQRSDSVEDAPGLQAARSAAAAAEADLKVARGRRYPSVGIGVTRTTSRVDGTFYNSIQGGLVLHGSFETGRGALYQVEAASAAREAAEHDMEYQRLTAETALATADQDMAGARARVAAYDRMMKLWRESRELYWKEYVLNKRSLSDVFNMERDIFSADAERIEAVKQGVVAALRAHAATGSLVDHLRSAGIHERE
ncbi:MAG: TolC family protein [Desulfovibrionaceae bacterium]|nr:TolC family protein [Desulfovibrionaceae bacterium]